jgi:3',5'-cyclic AMP phosphodiesterase CpdA
MSRTILHLSDLHFGRVPPGMAETLVDVARRIAPDVVVVSGDLTQRARIEEFEEASAFLKQLPTPQIVIPGNHDVPLFNPYGRFVERLARFRRYITPNLAPSYVDPELAVFGVNTARSLTWKGGRINTRQIEDLHGRLSELAPDVTRAIATHHPFGVARLAFERWARAGADLLLCGHLHIAATEIIDRTIVVNAGTAISTRGRGQANSFNVILIADRARITVTQWQWEQTEFVKREDALFRRADCQSAPALAERRPSASAPTSQPL